ncbi:MAG: recombinase RecA [Clostridia bacterium]|nr:recombinase RecA [Clostridia bacterium]
MAQDKNKALDTAIAQIEKQFGKGAIMRLGQQEALKVEVISTGSLSLDIALGIGGLPRGRIIEMYGPESSGKTTLALHCIAEGQKQGGTVAFIDVEHALDPVYAANLGVDVDSILVSQPDTGEQALEITEALVRSGAIDVIVVDSVAALVPKAEIEGEMGDSHVGLQARLMSQALRKLTGAISKSNCVAIFINQLREKVGILFGSPEVTPGGRALKFYSSVRLDIRKVETLKVNGELIGSHTKVKVVKNKMAPPFREAEFDIMYGKGISKEGEIVDLGVRAEVIQKSGAWFSYGERRLAQGRDKVKELLKNEPELAKEIEEKIMQNIDIINSKPLAKGSKTPKGKSKKEAKEEAEAEIEAESADIDSESGMEIEEDGNVIRINAPEEKSRKSEPHDSSIDISVDEEL